jgi:hypothetical protein
MAVRAKQAQIIWHVVASIPVNMVKLKSDFLTLPVGNAALRAGIAIDVDMAALDRSMA